MPEYPHILPARLITSALVIVMLTGCGGIQYDAGAQVISSSADESIRPIAESLLNAYEQSRTPVRVTFDNLPRPAIDRQLDEGAIVFAILIGPPPESMFSTPVGYVELTPIVHPGNQLVRLSFTDVTQIISGGITDFEDVGGAICPIEFVSLPEGYGLTMALEDFLPDGDSLGPGTRLNLTPVEARHFVSETPCGFAIIPSYYVTSRVQSLETGIIVDDIWQSARILLPVYWVSVAEPDGEAGEILDWIISDEGQLVISQMADLLR